MNAAEDAPPPLGTFGDEAAKLLSAAQEWFGKNLGDPETAKISTGAPECAWCPVCQVISVLRGDRPDITQKLAETQAALAGLFGALAEAVSSSTPGAHHQHHGTRVQKIQLSDEPPADKFPPAE